MDVDKVDTKLLKENNTINIAIEDVEEITENDISVNFSDVNLLDDFEVKEVDEKKEVVKENVVKAKVIKSVDEERKEIKEAESEGSGFTVSEFDMASGIIVDLLSWGLGSVLAMWSISGKSSDYEPTSESNKRLSKVLSKVLIKADMKFSFMSAFIMMSVITYGTLGKKAHNDRVLVKNKKNKESKAELVIVKDSKKENNTVIKKEEFKPLRRKRRI